ncbi:DUF2537 domain-containing protein [Nocardia sp. CNY236]|uniref:DUF2537 domain-containing protein n=1 Tax=Nocardia sp. CNY236 TaxID=1169152 RepID=UPI00040F9ADF|nr:DUF2537 domain-containing protein [Nocardia sp. CNY236]
MTGYRPDADHRRAEPHRDPTPWGAGLAAATMVALLSAVAVYCFGTALAEVHPVLAIVVNLVAVSGATPSVWRWRRTPVTRWVLAGAVAGVGFGWVAALLGALIS